MDMSTPSDEIPELLRSAYEVNLPPATFSVDELVAGGRRRRRRAVAGKLAGGAVAAAAIAGVAVASLSVDGGAGRAALVPPAAPVHGQPSARASLPPVGASAAVVIDAYLRALVSGDCTAAQALATSAFKPGSGELCGVVKVSSFALNRDPATPGRDEVIYASVLHVTEGSSDGTIPRGSVTWFYDLKRQDGAWKLVGGGSGP
jgi:hypothetical protein